MNKLLFILASVVFLSCHSETSKNKLFEEKIKKNLEDNAFKLNCSFSIIELKVNKIQPARLDSVYRELCYERLNKLYEELKKNNSTDYASVDNDEKYKELLDMKSNADINLRGSFVWYYIKGVFTNQISSKTNIFSESVLAYFDNNDNLLLNKLHFDK